MATTIHTAVLRGMHVLPVRLEVDVMRGLPGFYVVGLPGSSVREARERVRSSLVAAGKKYPLQRLVVNLVPGNIPKQSTYFDLPIAVGLLAETGQISSRALRETVFLGELSLTGSVVAAQGVFLLTEHARSQGYKTICVPYANYEEASMIEGIRVIPVRSLTEVCSYVNGSLILEPPNSSGEAILESKGVSLLDVVGQGPAKRALAIAAAGGHNLLMEGPPGCGKTMLAKCLPELLPPLSESEAVEVLRVHSAAGMFNAGLLARMRRPFRQVHHTSSTAALLGGGRNLMPGEVTLAHRGVLFLDELPEFSRDALEALREPLEDRVIHVRRVEGSVCYPAACMVVAAMNPCRCGFSNTATKPCVCKDAAREQYRRRISGPLLDRFDIAIEMYPVTEGAVPSKEDPREQILRARARQQDRGKGEGIVSNSEIPPHLLGRLCPMQKAAAQMLGLVVHAHQLSMRGRARLLRVARTIADMADRTLISAKDLEEAVYFRQALNQSSQGP